jgi:hypothetical protein
MTESINTHFARRGDEIVARYCLLQHPFHLAWSGGTLAVPALKDYAREYGAFIGTAHAVQFREMLGSPIGEFGKFLVGPMPTQVGGR